MFGTSAMSQTYFTITPMVGVQRCFAKYQSGDKPSVFNNNTGNDYFHVGFLLDYHRNRFIYSLGYMQNNAGYGYGLKPNGYNPSDTTLGWSYSHSTATPTNAIEAKLSYSVLKINLFKRKINSSAFESINNPYNDNQLIINFRLNVFE